jgi:DNA-binding NarL/FixJ family response regulator
VVADFRELQVTVTVLIADAQDLILEGFQRILQPPFAVIGTTTEPERMIELAEAHKPDLLVVDMAFQQVRGGAAVRQVFAMHDAATLIFTGTSDDEMLTRGALRAGASAYVNKAAHRDEILSTLYRVVPCLMDRPPGPGIASSGLRSGPLDDAANLPANRRLSQRQVEILELITQGKTAKEIGHILHLSPRTVEWHKQKLQNELNLRNTAALIEFGLARRKRTGE